MITKEKMELRSKDKIQDIRDELIDISVVIPVVEKYDYIDELYISYSQELKKITERFEVIFVIDGHMDDAYRTIKNLSHKYSEIRIIKFLKPLGESMALSAGFENARGKYIFTMPSYVQVIPEDIQKLYDTLTNDECDVVVARRIRKDDSFFNRLQSSIFHMILRLFTGTHFKDISCGLRGMKKEIVNVFDLYGNLHLFIPILAEHHGLNVKEIPVRQQKQDTRIRIHKMREYFDRFIDIVTIYIQAPSIFWIVRFILSISWINNHILFDISPSFHRGICFK